MSKKSTTHSAKNEKNITKFWYDELNVSSVNNVWYKDKNNTSIESCIDCANVIIEKKKSKNEDVKDKNVIHAIHRAKKHSWKFCDDLRSSFM